MSHFNAIYEREGLRREKHMFMDSWTIAICATLDCLVHIIESPIKSMHIAWAKLSNLRIPSVSVDSKAPQQLNARRNPDDLQCSHAHTRPLFTISMNFALRAFSKLETIALRWSEFHSSRVANTQTLQNHRQTHDRKCLQTYQQHLRKPAVQKKTMQFHCDHSAAESAHLAFLCIFCKLAGRASKVFLDFLIGSTHEILSEPNNYKFLYVSRDTLLIFEILSFYRFQAHS